MHPRISPRLLPESECKGTTFFRTHQMFDNFFSRKLKKSGFEASRHPILNSLTYNLYKNVNANPNLNLNCAGGAEEKI